jgi:hypothetical protein
MKQRADHLSAPSNRSEGRPRLYTGAQAFNSLNFITAAAECSGKVERMPVDFLDGSWAGLLSDYDGVVSSGSKAAPVTG